MSKVLKRLSGAVVCFERVFPKREDKSMKKYIATFLCCALNLTAECSFPSNTLIATTDEVRDIKTGLIWRRCALGQTWQNNRGCVGEVELMRRAEVEEKARLLGEKWRLPTLDELLTLVDDRCQPPVINTKIFGKVRDTTGEGANYLTASIYLEGDAAIPTLFYTIDLLNGSVDAHTKGFAGAVRLVR